MLSIAVTPPSDQDQHVAERRPATTRMAHGLLTTLPTAPLPWAIAAVYGAPQSLRACGDTLAPQWRGIARHPAPKRSLRWLHQDPPPPRPCLGYAAHLSSQLC